MINSKMMNVSSSSSSSSLSLNTTSPTNLIIVSLRLFYQDWIFIICCLVVGIRMTGIFIFLNEFSFVFENFYGFNETITGFVILIFVFKVNKL